MPNGKERFSDDVQLEHTTGERLAPHLLEMLLYLDTLSDKHIATIPACCGKCTEHPDFPNEDSI